MKELNNVYHNGDWYCPYCEQLNNAEKFGKVVQCSWCECESKISKNAWVIFQKSVINRPNLRKRRFL